MSDNVEIALAQGTHFCPLTRVNVGACAQCTNGGSSYFRELGVQCIDSDCDSGFNPANDVCNANEQDIPGAVPKFCADCFDMQPVGSGPGNNMWSLSANLR